MIILTEATQILNRNEAITTSTMPRFMPQLKVLYYSADILKEESLVKLNEQLFSDPSFKIPKDEDIRHEVMRYCKHHERPTF